MNQNCLSLSHKSAAFQPDAVSYPVVTADTAPQASSQQPKAIRSIMVSSIPIMRAGVLDKFTVFVIDPVHCRSNCMRMGGKQIQLLTSGWGKIAEMLIYCYE
jgi:hypothetical protein